MPNNIKIILSNSIILLVFLCIIEIGFRIHGHETYPGKIPDIAVVPDGKYFQEDSILGYKHRAGEYDITLKKEYGFSTHHDSNTLRLTSQLAENTSILKPSIWIFGCSFTHGWSINDHETFPWILQSKLDDFTITNWGVSGYGTVHFYLQFKEALKKRKKPNMIIINHADFHFERNSFSFQRRRNVSKWNFLGDLHQPYCTLDNNEKMHIQYANKEYNSWWLSKYSTLAYYFQIRYESYVDGKNKENEKIITSMLLDKIISLAKENEIETIITNIGSDPEFIQKYAKKKTVPFVDISVDIKESKYNNLPYDAHPNSTSNIIYTDKLYSFLKDSIL